MASWHNNFASPPNFPTNRDQNSHVLPHQSYSSPSILHTPPIAENPQPGFHTTPVTQLTFPPSMPLIPPQFQPNIPPPPPPPPMFNTALPPPIVMPPSPNVVFSSSSKTLSNMNPEDEFEKLKSYLEEHYRKSKLMNQMKRGTKKAKNLNVSEIKGKLVKCFGYIEQLESLTNCLQLAIKSLPEDEWFNHCEQAKNVKMELSMLMNEIQNPDFIRVMKKVVFARKKKREYKKRKLLDYQERKRVAKIHSEQESRNIDMWLEKMKDQVSRAKREEDIKREADLVLADVTSKKAEAKRMLNMLNALSKLRTARAHNASTDVKLSEQGTKAFNEIIDRLKNMWLEQFSGYKVEEEGLKVMLGHAEEERLSIEATKFRKNLSTWSQVIFGTSSLKPLKVEELIEIRHDWDTCICSDDAPMASSIPVGWVLPCKPSSEEWAKLL